MRKAYIGLGSNLDHPVKQIKMALDALSQSPDLVLKKCSSFYQSQPMGPEDQADFINVVVEVETDLSANDLLSFLQAIEKNQKRVRSGDRWGPRTIDLDILLLEDDVVVTKNLRIPHPGLSDREFVVYPLAEIAPNLILPNGEKIADIKAQCPQRGMCILPLEQSEIIK